MSPATIGERFDARDNAITPLRLVLALVVVFSHSWVSGGFGHDPLFGVTDGQMQLGTIAVIAFFGLSGFLLTATRARRTRGEFGWHRFLRIYPALAVCVTLTVVVVVPIAGALTASPANPDDVARWAIGSLSLQLNVQLVPGLYRGLAEPSIVNASLWTLAVEVACYAVLLLAPVRQLWLVLALMAGLAIGAHASMAGTAILLHLPVAFAVGGLLSLSASRVVLHGAIAGILVAVLVVAVPVGCFPLLAPVILPYVAIWLGVALPWRWQRDLSYGTYIYAWPIQQLLALAGLAAIGLVPYLGMAVLAILAAAAASTILVEEPALRLRAWRLRHRTETRAPSLGEPS